MTAMRRLFGLWLCAAVIGLLVPAAAPAAQRLKPRLKAFGSCTSLVKYARHNARRTGGTTGVETRVLTPEPLVLESPGTNVNELASAGRDRLSASEPAFSTTNVQEAGVDEPDIIKTDGRRIFALADGRLHALDATGATPKLVGSLKLGGDEGRQILLRGDRVLVMTTRATYSVSRVVLTEVDVSNPAAMVVRRTMIADGELVDARLTGSLARIVIATSPNPIPRRKIAHAGLRRWVPRTLLRSHVSGRTYKRSMVPCDSVRRPRGFSGLDLVSVLTIDMDKGLHAVDRDAILAGAQTVYASPTSLYIASHRYHEGVEDGETAPADSRTEIHRFDAPADGPTTYRSSGAVTGFVLNQFALSEHAGVLRVASTSEPPWFEGGGADPSQSYVTVLAERGSKLAAVGRVGGLGRGEEIYAVRFVGDRGYVVTFRQVDPLYTLDLSDPTRPRVAGQLKIRGYSAYLHPVSDTLLLGVGQDATKQGAELGTQLSLFDVSDPARPVRRAQVRLGDSYSEAEFDHHAFLYWKPANLAVIPLTGFGPEGQLSFEGAVGFRLGQASLADAGRITHPTPPGKGDGEEEEPPSIGRSLVIGDRLYTLSYAGLQSNRLDTLAPVSFTAFPAG